jgi:hypothetical protein
MNNEFGIMKKMLKAKFYGLVFLALAAIFVIAYSSDIQTAEAAGISGRVFEDRNQSGSYDGGDVPMSGRTVTLYNRAGTQVIATDTTDGNGNYSISGGNSSDRRITHAIPSGWVRTTDDSMPIDFTGNQTHDFGVYNPNSQEPTYIVSGFVYEDRNTTSCCSGTKDSGESGLSGRTVNWLTPGGSVIATTTTNSNGAYSFAVPAGNHRFSHAIPSGWVRTTDDSTVLSINGNRTYNFGVYNPNNYQTPYQTPYTTPYATPYQTPAPSKGSVTINSTQGSGGWTMTHTSSGTTYTGNGSKSFSNLPCGNYRLVPDPLPGFSVTVSPSQGNPCANN